MSEHRGVRTVGMWGKRAALGAGILVLGLVILAISNGRAYSMSNGTLTGFSTKGCTPCHGPSPSAGIKVVVDGPGSVAAGQTAQYKVSVNGAPEAGGGLDVSATGGKLSAGDNTQLVNNEITHKDKNSRSWTFSWTAPAAAGKYTLRAAGNAVNKDGTLSGDGWNLGSLDISVGESTPAAGDGSAGAGSPTATGGSAGSNQVSPAAPPVPKPPTLAITAPNAKTGAGSNVMTALLKDGAGKPISGATVNFYLDTEFFLRTGNVPVETTRGPVVQDYGAQDGKVQGLMEIGQSRTDANGVATLKYTPTLSGDLKLVAKYDGGNDGAIEGTGTWVGVKAINDYEPDIGINAPFLNPKIVLGTILGAIWSIFLFVLYQVFAISRDKTAYKEGR